MSTGARPLADLRVLITRPQEQAEALEEALGKAGAVPIVYPTIRVVPPETWEPLDAAFRRLAGYDWIVFTSPSAVRFALSRLAGPSVLSGKRIAAVGSGTARALAERGLAVEIVPDDERQEGLAAALASLPAGTRILFPQSVQGRSLLREELSHRGCIVEVVPVSQTLPIEDGPPPPPFDAVIFASPSALRAFVARHGAALLEPALVAVMGPTTAAAAAGLGLRVDVTAERPTARAVITGLARRVEQGSPSGVVS